ncbi:MAG TPA: zinc-binding dehydrogenase [Micromonosporaceae bacterium]|nr:zinc-binding dehydrogenase [Micromonosporaceae bacterium]
MYALQVVEAWRMVRRSVPVPSPAEGEATIRLRYATVCGSDVPKFTGAWPDHAPPLPLGAPLHECAGTVLASRIPRLLPGTPVLAIPNDDTGLAEVFAAGAERIAPLTDWSTVELPYAPLGQPAAAVLHGLRRLGSVRGARVTLIGLGGIGLICGLLLARRGIAGLTAIEPNAFRRTAGATLLGATVYSGWSATLSASADIVVEAVGHDEYGRTLQLCLDAVRPGGRILLLGNPANTGYAIGVHPLVRRNLTVVGSISPPWRRYLRAGARAVHADLAGFRSLITGRMLWHDAESVFREHADPDGRRIKILLENPVTADR